MQAARRTTECFQQELVRAATLPEIRMNAAAASLLVNSNLGSFLFRSSPMPRANFHARGWLAD
jgi:hypothetical protein